MYVYVSSEPELFTVGFYDPSGKWQPESDFNRREDAAARAVELNGGAKAPEPFKPKPKPIPENGKIKGYAFFRNDPSVGIFSQYFNFEIPVPDNEEFKQDRDEVELAREKIKELYSFLEPEFTCTSVTFDFENEDF